MLLKRSMDLNVTLFNFAIGQVNKKSHYCFCAGVFVAGIVFSLYGVSWIKYTRR